VIYGYGTDSIYLEVIHRTLAISGDLSIARPIPYHSLYKDRPLGYHIFDCAIIVMELGIPKISVGCVDYDVTSVIA
jgi:hypothetical protein